VLWTRLHTDAGKVDEWSDLALRWEIADDAAFRKNVRTGQALALSALNHSVHVEVDGLRPDRWYHYRFMLAGAVSPTGRTRTLPSPGAAVNSLRLAFASCQKWEDGYFTAWRHLRADDPDLVLFLGDYIYEYPANAAKLRVPAGGWVLGLDDYRARYAQYRSDPHLQAMHASCPWLPVWDDHEVQNDYAGTQAGNSKAAPGGFQRRRAAAYQAYYENMPLPASALTQGMVGLEKGAELRLYSSFQIGRLARIYMLDGRQYRDPQVGAISGGSGLVDPTLCAQWDAPQRSYLGAVQEQWLSSQLSMPQALTSSWNILGQQTLFGKLAYKGRKGERQWNDGWDGYAAARRRLTDALQDGNTPNPVILGGDTHENWVGHVLADYSRPDSRRVGVEFCGTSITSGSGAKEVSALLAANPHFVFADGKYHGYGLVDIQPEQLRVRLRIVEDVTAPDSPVRTLASFSVAAGRKQIQQD
jgi:alkaline phosphatase D